MGPMQVGTLLGLICASAAGALLTLVAAHFFYGNRLRELMARVDKSDKARAHTNDLLMQARRQAEALQKEVLHARRHRDRVAMVHKPSREVEPTQSERTSVIYGPAGGFAETLPMTSDRVAMMHKPSREAELTQGERTSVIYGPAGGFAETLPMTN